jgi:hypothetical protein
VNPQAASPPVTIDGAESFQQPGLLSTSLGGDDVLAFLEGCECDQWSGMGPSEVGIPAGWLSTVWAEFSR